MTLEEFMQAHMECNRYNLHTSAGSWLAYWKIANRSIEQYGPDGPKKFPLKVRMLRAGFGNMSAGAIRTLVGKYKDTDSFEVIDSEGRNYLAAYGTPWWMDFEVVED